jgi:hypothetical protein
MAVSTHMGIVFLLKTYSIWGESVLVKTLIIAVALINVFITTKSAKVQTSIKGTLAYSALAQVSVIIIEVALGLHVLALTHMGLHVFYRFTQMTNSPSIIDQNNLIERLNLGELNHTSRSRFYFLALHGFKSEIIVLKLFKSLLYPIILIDRLENKLLKYDDSVREKIKLAWHGGSK